MQAIALLQALGELWHSEDWMEGTDADLYHPKY